MPKAELEKLQAVNRFLKLKISKDEELHQIACLTAQICGSSEAFITLYGEKLRYVRYTQPCSGTYNEPMNLDESFQKVMDLTTRDGYELGNVSVKNPLIPELNAHQLNLLSIVGRQLVQLLEFDASLELLKEQYLLAKQEELKMQSFFDNRGSAHLLLDEHLRVIAYNKSMSNFIRRHYQVSLYPGFLIADMVKDETLAIFLESCYTALNGQSVQLERHLVYEEGEYWWEVSYQPARNPEGAIIGVSYNALDITSLIKQRKEAEIMDRKLAEIAHIQSHQVRRPVASIQGILFLMNEEGYLQRFKTLRLIHKSISLLDHKIHLIVNHTLQH